MKKRFVKLILKIFICLSFFYSNILYCDDICFNNLQNNFLSPKSNAINEMLNIEKKEVFIKNLIHGSSSIFFDFSNLMTAILGNIQFMFYNGQNQRLLEPSLQEYFQIKYNNFLNFNKQFTTLINELIISENKDIEKIWRNFKILSNEICNECEDINITASNLIKYKDKALDIDYIKTSLGIMVKSSEEMSRMLNITVNCIENEVLLFEVFPLANCLEPLLKIARRITLSNECDIEIDSSVIQMRSMILGNKILFDNVFENLLNNANQHKKEKVKIRVFVDNFSNDIVFAFENDADNIKEHALEKINERERLFYLNYSTKGMGVGTSISWFVSQMFNHTIRVINLENGVSFEYRIPILDDVTISIIEKIIKGKIDLKDWQKHLKKTPVIFSNSTIIQAA